MDEEERDGRPTRGARGNKDESSKMGREEEIKIWGRRGNSEKKGIGEGREWGTAGASRG